MSDNQTIQRRTAVSDRFLRAHEATALTSLSRSTLWRLEKMGNFPARRSLSPGAVGWLKSEVEAWIAERHAVGVDYCEPVVSVSRRGRKPQKENIL